MATEDPKHSEGEEEIALSHKLQRKLKRKRERGETDDATISKPKKAKTQTKDKEKTDAAVPIKRENSIWVGNLAYKTTAEDVRKFFDGVGEITRVNMPKGPIKGSATKRENSGYAFVDFAKDDAKQIAISMSEQNLHGRRLLIKDGEDFKGSKSATAALSTEGKPVSLTKSSRRILATQKELPCPVLFLGNLGYDATKEQVREMLLHHVQIKKKPVVVQRKAENVDEEAKSDATGERQARYGSPVSGECPGTTFCFLDFESIAHATAALIHPGNHNWNNRALILQYASLDAVRRGGYKDADGKRVFVKGAKSKPGTDDGTEGGETPTEVQSHPEPIEPRETREEISHPAVNDGLGELTTEPRRRGPTGGRTKEARTRPKPGAALAAAQRATAGIVPGQGTKVKFS